MQTSAGEGIGGTFEAVRGADPTVMLRSEHSIVTYQNGLAIPDRLTRK